MTYANKVNQIIELKAEKELLQTQLFTALETIDALKKELAQSKSITSSVRKAVVTYEISVVFLGYDCGTVYYSLNWEDAEYFAQGLSLIPDMVPQIRETESKKQWPFAKPRQSRADLLRTAVAGTVAKIEQAYDRVVKETEAA